MSEDKTPEPEADETSDAQDDQAASEDTNAAQDEPEDVDVAEDATDDAGAAEGAPAAVSEPDIADDAALDVEIEGVEPRPRRRGCSLASWVLFILVVAALAVFGPRLINVYGDYQGAKSAEAREQRLTNYLMQERRIRERLEQAAQNASRGDIEAAIERLEGTVGNWEELASLALSNKDNLDAASYADRAQGIKQTLKDLARAREAGAEYTELAAENAKKAAEYLSKAAEYQARAEIIRKSRADLHEQVRSRILEIAGREDVAAKPDAADAAASDSDKGGKADKESGDDQSAKKPKESAKSGASKGDAKLAKPTKAD